MTNQDFAQISLKMFERLSQTQIRLFFEAVQTSQDLLEELGASDLTPDSITSIARSRGFLFSGEQLLNHIEDCITTQLSEEEIQQRKDWLQNHSLQPTPIDKTDTKPKIIEIQASQSFSLNRGCILSGDVISIRKLNALKPLISIIRNTLKSIIGVEDLGIAHQKISHERLKESAAKANEVIDSNKEIPSIVVGIIEALGINPEDVLWEWPGFRMFFPSGHDQMGTYRNSTTSLLAPHRDTWFGSPQHQINLWGPIEPISEDKTLRILSEFHRKPLKNSSGGRDCWAHNLGLSLPPRLLDDIHPLTPLAPSLDVGDVMLFAGHALHASAPCERTRTRVSFEFRFLHHDDQNADYKPVNVDYEGKGEIYRGWFDQDATEINLFSGKPFIGRESN